MIYQLLKDLWWADKVQTFKELDRQPTIVDRLMLGNTVVVKLCSKLIWDSDRNPIVGYRIEWSLNKNGVVTRSEYFYDTNSDVPMYKEVNRWQAPQSAWHFDLLRLLLINYIKVLKVLGNV